MSTTAALDRRGLQAANGGLLALTRRHPLIVFFALVFVLTWSIQVPWIAGQNGRLPFQVPLPFVLLMGWMPGLAAIIVTGATSGKAGIRRLLGRIIRWRVGIGWYLVVLGFVVTFPLASQALDPVSGGTGIHLPALSTDLLVGGAVTFLIYFVVNSEEVAWRGFALTHLQPRHSALAASLIVGTIEGFFHLPYFFKPDTGQAAAGVPAFVVGSMGGAIVFTWLFNNTRGSVLLPMLFHSLINTWIDTLDTPPADLASFQWVFNALWLVAGAFVLIAFGANRLARKPVSKLQVDWESTD